MFVVLEIQKSDSIATLVSSHETRNEAESKYHTILAAASISAIPVHSAVLMVDNGTPIKYESYSHPVEPEPEPEPEPES